MHPIERLRYLARVDPSHVELIAREAAETLLACGGSAELVVACRRLLERHPACGPLWWVTATALTSADPAVGLLHTLGALDDDPTADLLDLEASLDPGAVPVDAWAAGRDGILASTSAAHAAAEALAAAQPVLVGVGALRLLAPAVWQAAVERLDALPRPPAMVVAWTDASRVIGPGGPTTPEGVLSGVACPVARELLR